MVKPHGTSGEVIVDLLSNRAERLAPGSELDGRGAVLRVVAARPHQGRHIVRFEGVGDRDAAEDLRGVVLRAEPVPTAADEEGVLWVHDLVDSVLVTADGRTRGRVVAVEANPASDLLVTEDGRLVPLVFVVERGIGPEGERRVVVDPPPGLLD